MVSLGGFSFDVDVNTSKAMQALDALTRRAQTARQELDRSLSGANPVVNTTAAQTSLGQVTTKANEAHKAASFTATPKVDTTQAQSALSGFGAGLKGAVALGAGLAGVTIGIGLVSKALTGAAEATQAANQAQFALTATYGAGAGAFAAFADAQAQALGRSSTEFKEAAVVASTLTRNYGLTADQIQNLIKRSADLAAIQGLSVADATNRVTSAIRGEAEAAELLGLTLNSDAIKAIADMTDEQRKNFETLDTLTKAQITYREFLRQTAAQEGAAAKAAADGTTAYAQAGDALKNLGVVIGQLIDPLGKGLAGAFRDTANAMSAFIEMERQLPGWAQRDTALSAPRRGGADLDIEGRRATQLEAARTARGQAAADLAQTARSEARTLGDRARETQQEITRSALENISERRKAETEAVRELREAETDRRDAAIAASNARKDAELAALDQIAQGRSRTRTIEDRERQAAQESELRGIQAAHDATLRGLDEQTNAIQKRRDESIKGVDDEIAAVDRKRDAALRAIDEETRAESRRHSEALSNIDAERDRKLGEVDAQLAALDAAAQRDQRRQTDQSLSRSLSDARRDLRGADTPEERRRALRAISDAEAAIQRERTNRLREDERARLRAAADEIRLAADTAKKVEDARNSATTGALSARQRQAQEQAAADTERLNAVKVRVQAETVIELAAIKERIDAEKIAYDQTVQDVRDAHRLANEAIADRRRDEDAALAASRVAIQKSHADEQAGIRAVSQTHLTELDQRLRNTIASLDAEKKVWDDWSRFVQQTIANAIAAGNVAAIQNISATPPQFQNQGAGPGEPPSRGTIPTNTSASTQSVVRAAPSGPQFGIEDVARYLTDRGWIDGSQEFFDAVDRMFELQNQGIPPPLDMIITGHALGGFARAGRMAMFGERGMEFGLPPQAGSVLPADVSRNLLAVAAGQSSGGTSLSIGNLTVTVPPGTTDPSGYAREIVRTVFTIIDAAERGSANPAPATLGGA